MANRPSAGLCREQAKASDDLGRPRLTGQPSSRTGENPPYGMSGGIEETSASFEARSAPRSYPTEGRGWQHPRLLGNPNTIYIGCDGGLFRSNNRGINWVSCNNGLVISEIEYLAQDYGSSRFLLAGTQDNGTQQWTGAPTWTHVADGDGGDCGVNRTNPR